MTFLLKLIYVDNDMALVDNSFLWFSFIRVAMQIGELAGLAIGATILLNVMIAG